MARGTVPIPIAERLWAKVDRSAGPDACWPFMGTRHKGYGKLKNRPSNVPLAAHRVAWEDAFGRIPDGLWVLHRCDNPPCCNPAHLFLGTQQDNNADMAAKGRRRYGTLRGTAHGRSLLNFRQCEEIRKHAAVGGIPNPKLAELYGVSKSTVWLVIHGPHWSLGPQTE